MEEIPFVVNRGQDDDYELKVGMKVNSEDEAYQLYNNYAIRKGFSVRKGTYRYVKSGLVRARNFLCSKAGVAEDSSLKERTRLETRTNCKARIVFTIINGVWEITTLEVEHNHELATQEERQFLRSGRKIQPAQADVIKSMVEAGIKPTNTYNYLAKEVGGSENVGFTKRDCHNFLRDQKKIKIEAGDGQSLINHFKKKQAEDPMFFYAVQVDEKNRMTNFFWRDGRSRLDYDCFGDVVMFDTTYRTNKYNMVCAPFVGINHHWKNVFFGCAFLLSESTESFIWLFETFLTSMGNQKPKTIFTDQCQAMSNAISLVLSGTCHRLCLWHISTKAPQKLAKYYGDADFKFLFNKCLYGCQDKIDFEANWSELIQKVDPGEQRWLNGLYNIKEKWCAVFTSDTFSARARSTQRSESTNNVFHQMSNKTMNLTEFVLQYEEQSNKMRLNELEEDFRCKQGVPRTVVNNAILKHAAQVYTIKMFKVFQEEFLNSLSVRINSFGTDGGICTYELIQSNKVSHIVQSSAYDCTIMCSCKMFESMGILCRHCLRVLDMQNIIQVPMQYILKRWTREAKKGSVLYDDCGESSNLKSSKTLRLSKLLHSACRIMHRCSDTDEGTKIAEKNLERIVEELDQIEKDLSSLQVVGDLNGGGGRCETEDDGAIISCKDDSHCSIAETRVLDPPCVRQKGVTNARLKSNLEKKQKKKASKAAPSSHTIPPNIHREKYQPQLPSNMYPFNVNLHNQLFSTVTLPTTNICTSQPSSSFQFTNLLQSSDPNLYLNQVSMNSNAEVVYPWFGTGSPK